MDPNIYESLGIDSTDEKNSGNKELTTNELLKDENNLKTVATIILIVGIISAVILFFTTALVFYEGTYNWQDKIIWSWQGFATTITTLFYSVGIWAFLNVVSNVSITLKEIKNSK